MSRFNLSALLLRETRYFKLIEGGYLTAIGTGDGGTEITAEEYEALSAVLAERPTPPEGCGYRLTEALEWEPYELPPAPDPETEPVGDAAEALKLLLGGAE